MARKSETINSTERRRSTGFEILESQLEVGAGAGRLEGEQLADDAEGVAPALPGWNHPLDPVGKEQGADPIVIARGRECKDSTDFGGQVPFGPDPSYRIAWRR